MDLDRAKMLSSFDRAKILSSPKLKMDFDRAKMPSSFDRAKMPLSPKEVEISLFSEGLKIVS